VLEPNPKSEPDPGFAGVGMTLRSREGAILIEDVFEGGPAREAGLRPGDLLMQVDNVPTAGTPLGEVVGRIRGEVGTPVSLVVRRGGRDFLLNIARAAVRF
jgi:carboxyl-terminal processing protease